MKKILLPLIVLAASGGYVWSQQGQTANELSMDAVADTPSPAAAKPTPPAEATLALPKLPAPEPAPIAPPTVTKPEVEVAEEEPRQMVGYVDVTQAQRLALPPRPVLAADAGTADPAGLKDGAFTGTVADAYYGPLQVKAQVVHGKLAKVQVLQFPNDRRTSRRINAVALPLLTTEAIQAQGAEVDYVTGATLTSRAFRRSLSDALKKAIL